jgi:hypothetical protein
MHPLEVKSMHRRHTISGNPSFSNYNTGVYPIVNVVEGMKGLQSTRGSNQSAHPPLNPVAKPVIDIQGTRIRNQLRSGLFIRANIFSALVLAVGAHLVAIAFSIPGSWPPSMDLQLVTVLTQILITLSGSAIRECFLMSGEVLRWSLVTRGTVVDLARAAIVGSPSVLKVY